MGYTFREAKQSDLSQIWDIINDAILRRKQEGSNQWQDGYPNWEVIQNDIQKTVGFVLTEKETIVGYCAVIINDEPAYANINGKWLTTGDFVVLHRIAVSKNHLGKGLAKQMLKHIEEYAMSRSIKSVKADTNFDNAAMITIFKKMGYTYCGEITARSSARMAFEKMLS
jgi:GNAT superfamily N-acetyltransferase